MGRHRGWWEVGIEEHIATPRDVQLGAERELFDQGRNPVEFSLVAQLLEVDVVKGECVVAQVGEDVTEQVRVPADQQNEEKSCQLLGDHSYKREYFARFSEKIMSDDNLSMKMAPCSSLLV